MVQISIYFYFLDYFPGTVAIKHLPGNLSETEWHRWVASIIYKFFFKYTVNQIMMTI